jgi:hypothetical protein
MRFDTEGAARSSLQPSLCERYRSLFNFPTMIPTLPDQHPKCMRHKECINPTRKIGTHNFRHNHTISSKKRQFPPPAVLPHPINNAIRKNPKDLPRHQKNKCFALRRSLRSPRLRRRPRLFGSRSGWATSAPSAVRTRNSRTSRCWCFRRPWIRAGVW